MILSIMISTNVYAKEVYSEYEFIGYTPEAKENDELYKYEKTKMNRFYKLERINEEYLEKDGTHAQEFLDEQDIKWEDNYVQQVGYYDKPEGKITIDSLNDYTISQIKIYNLKDYAKVNKIEIVQNGALFKTIEKENISREFTLSLNDGFHIRDLEIVIYYETTGLIEFRLLIEDDGGTPKIEKEIRLQTVMNKCTINTLETTDFNAFVKKTKFTVYNNMVYYYNLRKPKYKFYDIEKVYYKDSEEREIEGYLFDEEESYEMYKIYKREKIEIEEPPSEHPKEEVEYPEENKPEEKPEDKPEEQPENPKDEDKPTDKEEEPKDEVDATDKEKPSDPSPVEDAKDTPKDESSKDEKNENSSTTTKYPDKVITVVPNSPKKSNTTESTKKNVDESKEKEITEQIEIENIGKTYETVDNQSKKNLLQNNAPDMLETTTCTPKVNSLTVIGFIMILASLILTGIHYYNVNFQNDND